MFSVENPHGLHARPAARLVSEVRALDASVQLRNLTTGGSPVPAGSLSRVATLAALRGHQVEVRASGPQAQEAVEHLLTLAARRFDETVEEAVEPPARVPAPHRSAARWLPRPGSRSARFAGSPPCPSTSTGNRWGSRPRSGAASWRPSPPYAATSSTCACSPLVRSARDEASIFDAHLSLLTDAEMLADVKTRTSAGLGAVSAWAGCLADVERAWASLPDPYLRERAADVHAVAEQVLRALTGEPDRRMTAQGVLVADDLTPAETAGLDLDLVTGVLLAHGSPSSHAAILARARDIPVVVAAGPEVLTIAEGTTVLLDGAVGELHVDPGPALLEEYERRAADAAAERAQQLALAEEPAVSRDGVAVAVAANLGSVADARAALAAGADGAGLVRTEFLFLDRSAAPGVEEQQVEYDAIAEAMDGRRITLRTLDVGGDKPLSYLPVHQEANPFLGHRGIRLSLDHRDLLRDQMAAICHTARSSPTSMMIPMVSTPGEMIEALPGVDRCGGTGRASPRACGSAR